MMSTIPFEVPAELLSRLASGELVRYGTILKDSVTGQIVRHVQETGVAQTILSNLAAGPFAPISMVADIVNAGASIYTGVQVSQLKAMLEVLQSLQVATLGVSLAGVAVSVAGFYHLNKRFTALEKRMDQVGSIIRAGFNDAARRDLRVELHRTKGLLQRAQQAPHLSDSRREYSEVAAALADRAAFFEGEMASMTAMGPPIDLEVFWQLAQMLMLCNSVRIDCWIRANELQYALTVSEAVSSEYDKLFTDLTPLSFGPAVDQGLAAVRVLRDAGDAAASKPYLIDYLRTQRINGADYIEAIEREKSSPYLLLNTCN